MRRPRRNPDGCTDCGCVCSHCVHVAPLPGQLPFPGIEQLSQMPPAEICPRCHRCRAGCCDCRACAHCNELVDTVCGNCDRCEECCECHLCEHRRHGEMVDSVCDACNYCPDHCECIRCERCNDIIGEDDNFCSECDRCESCCNCTRCHNCNVVVDSICDACSECESCCSCSPDVDEEDETGGSDHITIRLVDPPAEWTFHHKKLDRSSPTRFVGTEIEFIPGGEPQVDLQRAVKRWGAAIVHDGSVQPGERELVTAPAMGKAYREQINELTATLDVQGASVNASCGLHVHINGRDYHYHELRRLMRMWSILEPGLFLVVPRSRRNHSLLKECGEWYKDIAESGKKITPQLYRGKVKSIGHGKEAHYYPYHFRTGKAGATNVKISDEERRRLKYDGVRYHTLNVHAWYFQGTLEFRMHSGTTNERKICNWVDYLSHVVELASRWTDKEVAAWMYRWPNGTRHRGGTDGLLHAVLTVSPSKAISEYLIQRYEHFNETSYGEEIPPPQPLPKMNPPQRSR